MHSTVGGSDGQYSLTVPVGIYRVTYSHPSYQSYEFIDFPVDGFGLQVFHVRLAPLVPREPFDDPTSGFAGGVYDRQQLPVSGATLVFEREVDGSIRETTSDQVGRYRILLPRGRYYRSASHPEAGIQSRVGFTVLCESGLQIANFFLYQPATPTPTPDPDNPRCGDGRVDPGEDCDGGGFCSGFCGKRLCVDYGCQGDCTCPHLELGGTSCCARAFHAPGCRSEPCKACVCEADPFCCEVEWDVACSGRAAGQCSEICSCTAGH